MISARVLEIIRSNRLEALLDTLAKRLKAHPLEDPMVSESIVVPSRGMERWLSQRLSHSLGADPSGRGGICAHVTFPFPAKIAQRALDLALNPTQELAEPLQFAAWDRNRLVWHVLDSLAEGLDSQLDSFSALATYLGHRAGDSAFAAGVDRRAFGLAKRIATIFDRYGQHRPDIVAKLRAAESCLPSVPSKLRWQAALWQAVEARIDEDPFCLRQRAAQEGMAAKDYPAHELAPRLSFFGFASIPPALLATFDALSRHIECQLYVLTPALGYWADTRARKQLLREVRDRPEAIEGNELALAEAHPLLASSGRSARDFQAQVESQLEGYRDHECFVDPLAKSSSAKASVLASLQSDLLHLRNRELDDATSSDQAIAPGDRSIQVHACHGKTRQVTVLREAILRALDDDESLECRDILVMSPDIETYAPIIEAVFGRGAYHRDDDEGETPWGPTGTPKLRVNVADRSGHARDPIVRALTDLLALVTARRSLGEVIDLLNHEVVRERFEIEADDVDRLLEWSNEAGARWGSDAAHRESFGQPRQTNFTWRAALDRMTLGVTMADEGGMWAGLSPFDAIEGQSVDLFAKFSAYCDTLFRALDGLQRARPLPQWAEALGEVGENMLSTESVDSWRTQRLNQSIAGLVELSKSAETAEPSSEEPGLAVTLEVISKLLVDSIDQGGHAIGQQGAITFCAMAPMRSIPHRIVALLGMDHGVFPRPRAADGFDLMASEPKLGDPNPRDAERFLFLEALLAARDRFIVTYEGRKASDGEALPPANAVRELLEHITHAFVDADGNPGGFLIHEHLHAHDPRYFHGADASFDLRARAAAKAWVESGSRAPEQDEGIARELAKDEVPARVELDTLIRALQNPARVHAQSRLGVFLPFEDEDLPQREGLELDNLERYELDNTLLRLDPESRGERFELSFEQIDEERQRLDAQGLLPPGGPGAYALAKALQIRRQLEGLRASYTPEQLREHSSEFSLEVEGVEINARLKVNGDATRLLMHRKKAPSAKHELRAWIEHLAWQSTRPDPVETVWLAAGAAKAQALPRLSQDEAHAALAKVVEAYLENLQQPLAFFPKASLAYAKGSAEAKLDSDELLRKCDKEFTNNGDFSGVPGEGREVYNALLWGEEVSLTELSERSAFADTAQRIWGPYQELKLAAKAKKKSKKKSSKSKRKATKGATEKGGPA
jgi:exodeoxyribonuclease V gamma subunit